MMTDPTISTFPRTYKALARFRWLEKAASRYVWERVLQQAHECQEDKSIEWRDVPVEVEK